MCQLTVQCTSCPCPITIDFDDIIRRCVCTWEIMNGPSLFAATLHIIVIPKVNLGAFFASTHEVPSATGSAVDNSQCELLGFNLVEFPSLLATGIISMPKVNMVFSAPWSGNGSSLLFAVLSTCVGDYIFVYPARNSCERPLLPSRAIIRPPEINFATIFVGTQPCSLIVVFTICLNSGHEGRWHSSFGKCFCFSK